MPGASVPFFSPRTCGWGWVCTRTRTRTRTRVLWSVQATDGDSDADFQLYNIAAALSAQSRGQAAADKGAPAPSAPDERPPALTDLTAILCDERLSIAGVAPHGTDDCESVSEATEFAAWRRTTFPFAGRLVTVHACSVCGRVHACRDGMRSGAFARDTPCPVVTYLSEGNAVCGVSGLQIVGTASLPVAALSHPGEQHRRYLEWMAEDAPMPTPESAVAEAHGDMQRAVRNTVSKASRIKARSAVTRARRRANARTAPLKDAERFMHALIAETLPADAELPAGVFADALALVTSEADAALAIVERPHVSALVDTTARAVGKHGRKNGASGTFVCTLRAAVVCVWAVKQTCASTDDAGVDAHLSRIAAVVCKKTTRSTRSKIYTFVTSIAPLVYP